MPNLERRVNIVRLVFLTLLGFGISSAQAADIVHDTEYYILEAQNGKAWAVEDGKLDPGTSIVGFRIINQPLVR